jgi:hypothetical protein
VCFVNKTTKWVSGKDGSKMVFGANADVWNLNGLPIKNRKCNRVISQMDQHLLKKECKATMNSMKYGKVGYWLKKVYGGRQSAAGHVDLPAGRTFLTGVLMKICGHDKMD